MYRRLFSETVIYGIGAIMPRLINFLMTRAYTHSIEPSEFSTFANLYATASLLNVLLSFGFETSYFRFSSDYKEKTVFNVSNIFLIFNALLFLVLVYTFLNPIAELSNYEDHVEYLRWFAWIIAFDTISVIPFAWLRYHNKPIIYSGIRLLSAFVNVAFTLILLNAYHNETVDILWFTLKQNVSFPFFANLIASALTLGLLLPILLRIKWEFDKTLFRKMIKYSIPIMLAGVAFAINENFDKMVQKYIILESEAGAYAICYKLGALLTLFVTAFRMGVEPFLFKQMYEEDAKHTYATIMEYFVIVCGIIMLGILGNIEWIKNIFITNSEYLVALFIVPIIIIANAFYGIYHNLAVWYKTNDQTRYGGYFSWIGAAITILVNLIFLPVFGMEASAWATIAAYGLMMVLSYIVGQRKNHIPYKTRKIVFYLLLAIVFSVVNFYLLNMNSISGNLFLFVYLFIIYTFEKDYLLKNFIKK